MNSLDPESADKPNHNLPAQTTGFVGREQELDDLARLLDNPTVRLVTLLAPGGMGKTRLALAVARQQLINYVDGGYFVPLAPLESIDSIIPTIASAISLQFHPGTDPLTQLLDGLRNREMLLVLDNYEHLLDGANLITAILQAAPRVAVMVTSRERLHLSSETVYLVVGMDSPDRETIARVLDYSAVQLFLQGAWHLRPDWDVATEDLKQIARISHLTQGMPLAIILASAWVNLLSLAEIANEVEHNLDFLQTELRDLPERLHSVRAVFEGTWKRLSEEERQVFRRLSVFRGGCLREAVTRVTAANLSTLQGLVDKALLVRTDTGRYEVHEVLRQYGEERLAETAQEYTDVRDLHCDYYANFTLQMYEGHHASETKMWLALMDTELENLQYGWDWAIRHGKRDALWQFSKLYLFYALRCRYAEGEAILARSVAALENRDSGNQPDLVLARLLTLHVFLCHYTIQIEKMNISSRKCLAIMRQIDDLGKDRETVAVLYFLGSSLYFIRPEEARALLEECIVYCRQYNHRDALMVAILMNRLSFVPELFQDIVGIEEGLHQAQQLDYLRGIAMFTQYRGIVAYWAEGDADAAIHWLNKAIDLHRSSDDPLNLAGALVTLGDVAWDIEDYQEAKVALVEALNLFDTRGCLPWMLSPTLVCVAQLLVVGTNMQGAAELCACVQQAPFLNHPRFHPLNLVKDADPGPLWETLEIELTPAEVAVAAENGRSLDMATAIKRALDLLEQTEILSAGPLVLTDFDVLNQELTDPVTPREFEVFQYILAGYSNRAIATELVISRNTLKTHISRLYDKLIVENRTQAILRGRELGLLK